MVKQKVFVASGVHTTFLWEALNKSWPEEEKGHFLLGWKGGDPGNCHVGRPGAHHYHSGHGRRASEQ